ncbi:2TM domain-containing protein [Salegentibacter sediminis]|uniref:2TM domain-containing protein n=1 Tax=Salegentibacter sediminis TaxID=1930251 RepID=UPI0009C175B0|nr:2TM domain-containing protein [Salegentibacter sediminis]
MFSKKKNTSKLDTEQRELYDNARHRILQKRRLFQHFVVFLIGAIFLIVLNVVIGYKEDFKILGYDWFVTAILFWAFLFFIHLINVFVINSFMGKAWKNRQMERLVSKQKAKIAEMQKQVEKQHPLPEQPKKPTEHREELKPGPENPNDFEDFDQPYNT